METKKAYLIEVGADPVEITPANGKSFTYEELKGYINGTLTIVPLPDGRSIVADDNGKLLDLPVNEKASEFWQEQYPISKYPFNNDGTLVGTVIVAPRKMVR